jgi:CBS domain-containing protein
MTSNSDIKAIDIMTSEVVLARPDMSVAEAARLMNIFRIGGLPVVEEGKLIGMLTERDIMRHVVAANKKASEVLVSDVMTSPPKVFGTLDEPLSSLAEKILKFDVTRIPIVDNERRVVGIVTNRDVVKCSTEYLETLLEQAKIKGELRQDYAAFGKCELCQQPAHLVFKDNRFVCENCLKLKI